MKEVYAQRRTISLSSTLHSKTYDREDQDDHTLDKLHVPIHMKKSLWDHVIKPLYLEHNHDMKILLSVSGGCDSIALFYSILELVEQNKDGSFYISFHDNHHIQCEIHVVHFDHGQRGESSQGDRLYVEQICKQYGIPFHAYFWNDENHGGALSNSAQFSQERARNWRIYETQLLMERIKRQKETGIIVTAHHRDDVEETVLMKMLRGVHITNISGMDVLRQAKEGIYFVKPLLNVRKKDLEGFLLQKEVSWREDESNTSNKYLRNRVRNELIPLLHDIIGGQEILSNRLDNIQSQSKKLRTDITFRANHVLKEMHDANDGKCFILPKQCIGLDAVQEEALFQWAKMRTNDILHLSYDKICAVGEQLSDFPERLQWKLSVGGGWEIERNGYVFSLHNKRETRNPDSKVVEWTIVEKETDRPMTDDNARFHLRFKLDDLTKIDVKRAGDMKAAKFHPTWRSNTMKLKDFLRGQKVPLHRRDCTPILSIDVDGEMTVLAVYIEAVKVESETINGKWYIHRDYNVEEADGVYGCRELELYSSFRSNDEHRLKKNIQTDKLPLLHGKSPQPPK
jgi:tRNA(Ile)-lysidine synthase